MKVSFAAGLGLILLTTAVACKPSAKVTQTTPVANLQSYGVVGVRAAPGSYDPNLTRRLVDDTIRELSSQCQFTTVAPAEILTAQTPDLFIDLNLRSASRGGIGLIQNENKAFVEVLAVLSDGASRDLLGTAWINGESAAVLTNAASPEQQAVGAVAAKIGQMLTKSGCTGPRVARAEPPAPVEPPAAGTDTSTGTDTGTDTNTDTGAGSGDARAAAEAKNDEGKQLFVAANIQGALGKFREALALFADPRYEYNICLAHEALKQFDQATAACQNVAAQKKDAALANKAQGRLEIIAELRAQ